MATEALPRVTIRYCTQCKWQLRAAYYAQELLSTFSSTATHALAEVALQPATGGTFTVDICTRDLSKRIWDRKEDGGFPETKELKRRVRDVVEPDRDLGHVDRHAGKSAKASKGGEGDGETAGVVQQETDKADGACEDCK